MDLKTLWDNFDAITEAENGIQQLRRLILISAVRGMLVQQSPKDESAENLLKELKENKDNLSKKQTKKHKSLPEITNEEFPFQLPKGWIFVRLGNLFDIVRGSSPRPKNDPTFFATKPTPFHWITIADITAYTQNDFLIDTDQYLTEAGVQYSRKVDQNDIIIAASGSVGKACRLGIEGFIYDGLMAVKGIQSTIIQSFLLLYFKTIELSLLNEATGTSWKNINTDILRKTIIPLPPLAEQEQIVEKVDELMELCDHAEASQQNRNKLQQKLRRSAIHALETAETEEEFDKSWHFVRDNFSAIIRELKDVKDIRSTILELSIRGKFKKQRSYKESASLLLETIKKKNNNLKKQKNQSKKKDNTKNTNPPYNIPKEWCWAKIEDCFDISGGIQKTPQRQPISNFFPYLRVANVQRGKIDLSEINYFELFEGELERWRLEYGDLLIVEGNGSEKEIGRCAVWQNQIDNCVHQNHIIRARPIGHDGQFFTLLFLNSPSGISEMKNLAITTTGLYSLSVSKIRNILIPFPPLEEQKRIVAKVDELMEICDRVEENLSRKEELANAISASVIHHLEFESN